MFHLTGWLLQIKTKRCVFHKNTPPSSPGYTLLYKLLQSCLKCKLQVNHHSQLMCKLKCSICIYLIISVLKCVKITFIGVSSTVACFFSYWVMTSQEELATHTPLDSYCIMAIWRTTEDVGNHQILYGPQPYNF